MNTPTHRRRFPLALLLTATLSAAHTASGQTRTWTHGTEADFRAGTLTGMVVANTGELRLSRGLRPVLVEDGRIGLVLAMAEGADGTVYVGTGPSGRVLAKSPDGTVRTVLELGVGEMVTALHVTPGGTVLVGVSGEVARVVAVSGEQQTELLPETGAAYVWAIRQAPGDAGRLYFATGPTGQLYSTPSADQPAEEWLDLEEDNLTALAVGAGGEVYVGTEPRGLVYRVNPETRRARVLLDAPEGEIVALVLDVAGNVYAAASVEVEEGSKAEFPERGLPDGAAMPELPSFPDGMRPPPPVPRAEPASPHELPDAFKENDGPAEVGGATLSRGAAADLSGEGSAVYRIDAEGFATEVLRGPMSLMDLALSGESLFVATGKGGGGQLYEVNLSTDEVTVAARADAEFVTTLLRRRSGALLVGTGSTGGVVELSATYRTEGSFTSSVLDAGHSARFGMIRLDGTLPPGTRATVSTRSGNTDEPTPSGWSEWSDPVAAERFTPVTAPVGRYLQYRVTFFASADGSTSPQLREVEVSYRVPNLPPKVAGVTVERAGASPEAPKGGWKVSWEAEDANGDALEFTLEYRPVGEVAWRPLREKLKESEFAWDTREVPDGRYQVRVVADDAGANPPEEGRRSARVSRAFLIDNTPPGFGEAVVTVEGDPATIRVPVRDLAGVVRVVAFRVGASEQWQNAESEDKLFDSPQEDAIVVLRGLLPGRHVVRIRATDDSGNESFETVIVSVPGGAGSRRP